MRHTATVTSKGEITVPLAGCERLGLKTLDTRRYRSDFPKLEMITINDV